ncbi:MAG: hypothetical protein LAO09_16300 [Acidobacteriia bacterium]|nr:hypothetical protein [Terriglobia bacterium]
MKIAVSRCFLSVFLAGLMAPVQLTGQTSPVSEPAVQTKDQEKTIENREQSQRALGILPRFTVTNRQDAPPLTAGGKFRLFARGAFDPFTFGLVGIQAGVSQAENQFPDYGQGAVGYGKRYGAAFGDQLSNSFFRYSFYATLLKEDPRYFRMGRGPVKHRFVYALKREFICHTDKGGRSFSWANALGALSSGALSNAYYPEQDRGVGLTMGRAGLALLFGSAGGLVNEFWPDISRKPHHSHNNGPPQ